MSDNQTKSPSDPANLPAGTDEPIHFMQRLLDNHFLLLALGVAVPAVLYMVWGLMEVAMIPVAQ